MVYLKKVLLLVGFIVIGSFLYRSDRENFIQQQQQVYQVEQQKDLALDNFSDANISSEIGNDIFFTPDKKLLDTLVTILNTAKNRAYINTYIFTEKRMRQAVIEAKSRGVDVKIILEKNVYKSPHLNDVTYEQLQSAGVNVVWSDSSDFSLNHAKYMIIDDLLIISTGNHSYSTFTNNVDIFVFISQDILLRDLQKIFLGDFEGEKTFVYDDNLVLSSFDARGKLDFLIKSAEKNIQIYMPYLEDKQIEEILSNKIRQKIEVNILTGKENQTAQWVKNLQNVGADFQFSSSNIHAKAVLVDNALLYIGSTNFSTPSIEKNREVGVLLKNKKIIQDFQKHFTDDFIN